LPWRKGEALAVPFVKIRPGSLPTAVFDEVLSVAAAVTSTAPVCWAPTLASDALAPEPGEPPAPATTPRVTAAATRMARGSRRVRRR
jgi:hypothetical protein